VIALLPIAELDCSGNYGPRRCAALHSSLFLGQASKLEVPRTQIRLVRCRQSQARSALFLKQSSLVSSGRDDSPLFFFSVLNLLMVSHLKASLIYRPCSISIANTGSSMYLFLCQVATFSVNQQRKPVHKTRRSRALAPGFGAPSSLRRPLTPIAMAIIVAIARCVREVGL